MSERHRAGAERPRAFILTGALPVVCRDSIYIDDLRRRDLKVLVITATAWHGYAEAHRDDPAHPASAIEEVAFVDGSVESEGSFLPGVIEHAGRWREKYDVVGIYAVGETLVEPTGLVGHRLAGAAARLADPAELVSRHRQAGLRLIEPGIAAGRTGLSPRSS